MSAASSSSNAAQKPALSFEFTKRKRWADLLITELADAIILILSSSCKVLYCGTAVTELLGWKEVDLIDSDLGELIKNDERSSFRTSFDTSVQTNTELLSHVHLKCKNVASPYTQSTEEVLFEITGYPYFIPDDPNCKCFFAMAKPYPSRNTAMLNMFLELKMENERLQQRLAKLRLDASTPSSNFSTSSEAVYPSSSMSSKTMPQPPILLGGDSYPSLNQLTYDEGTTRTNFDINAYAISGGHGYTSNPMPTHDEDTEDMSRKKKLKKSHTTEQYVCMTCGRTDSPEWRKGPAGPKTLCNACGLRWAKQMRKCDESTPGLQAESS